MKEVRVEVRMSEELKNMLKFKSVGANKNLSDYIRDSITQSEIKFNDAKDVSQVISSINKIGNNLNQIAHILNIANKSDSLSDINYNELKDELLIIMHGINEITKC
jgi:hypothetical protein